MLCYGEQSMTSVQIKCVISKSTQSEIQIKTQQVLNKHSGKFTALLCKSSHDVATLRGASFDHQLLVHLADYSAFRRKKNLLLDCLELGDIILRH